LTSFRSKPDARRRMFLMLSGQIEGQLRDAYAKRHAQGVTQSRIAQRLGINRAAVNHRLKGETNMTIETIADMVWALDYDIDIDIFDPTDRMKNSLARPPVEARKSVPQPKPDTRPASDDDDLPTIDRKEVRRLEPA